MLIGLEYDIGYCAGHCDKHRYNQSSGLNQQSTSRITGKGLELSEHVVLIGACGWQHKGWSGAFYPEDLPEEWQLGYYGNEFPVVIVPADYWATEADTFEQWLQESDESLQMICEWPAAGASQVQINGARLGIAAVSDRVLSILISIHSEVSESELARYRELAEKHPLSFDIAPDLDAGQRDGLLSWLAENLVGRDYGVCWRADQAHKQDLTLGSVSVTRISAGPAGEIAPKDLREILETLMAASSKDCSQVLIVDGEPPSMQLLTNAGIILDLL